MLGLCCVKCLVTNCSTVRTVSSTSEQKPSNFAVIATELWQSDIF